jgi:DNA primase
MVSPVTMRALLSTEIKDEIRRRVDLAELVGAHVALKKAGRSFKGLCPFHQEKTPSFTVDPEKGLWFCHGCKLGGDVFDFMMRISNLSFMEAAEALAKRAGVRLERSPEEAARATERDRMYGALEAAAGFFRDQLFHAGRGTAARAYLERRGVDAATGDRFRLGYAPAAWDDLQKVLGGRGFAPALLEKTGLVNARASGDGFYDLFRNRLMFPIVDLQDRVVGFGGRALDDSEPKYLNSRETPIFVKGRTLYALNWAREAVRKYDELVIVEGNMDVLTAHQYGIANAVASLGTALTADQVQVMRRLASRAVIVYDADASGQAAMERAMALFEEADLPVRVVVLPAGDPDEFLRTRGVEAFRGLIAGALPVFEYQLRMAAARHDPQTVDGKVRIVDELLPVVSAVSNPVRQAEYVRVLAERFDLREDAVRQRLRARREGRGASAPARGASGSGRATGGAGGRGSPDVPVASQDTARARAERWLLHLMVHVAELRRDLATRLSAEEFTDPVHRALAGVLLGAADADPDRLRSALNDEPAERLLLGLLFEEPPVEEKDRERVVNESVEYLVHRQRAAGRFDALQKAISAAQAAGDVQQVRRLQTEYEELIGMMHASRKGGETDGQEKDGA